MHTAVPRRRPLLGAALALIFMVLPLSLDIPSTEALMIGVIAREVAVLYDTMLVVAAERKVRQFEVAHSALQGRQLRLSVEPREKDYSVSETYTTNHAVSYLRKISLKD